MISDKQYFSPRLLELKYDSTLKKALQKSKIISKRLKQRKKIMQLKFRQLKQLCLHIRLSQGSISRDPLVSLHYQLTNTKKDEKQEIEKYIENKNKNYETNISDLTRQSDNYFANKNLLSLQKNNKLDAKIHNMPKELNQNFTQTDPLNKSNFNQKDESSLIQISEHSTPQFLNGQKTPSFVHRSICRDSEKQVIQTQNQDQVKIQVKPSIQNIYIDEGFKKQNLTNQDINKFQTNYKSHFEIKDQLIYSKFSFFGFEDQKNYNLKSIKNNFKDKKGNCIETTFENKYNIFKNELVNYQNEQFQKCKSMKYQLPDDIENINIENIHMNFASSDCKVFDKKLENQIQNHKNHKNHKNQYMIEQPSNRLLFNSSIKLFSNYDGFQQIDLSKLQRNPDFIPFLQKQGKIPKRRPLFEQKPIQINSSDSLKND